MSDKFTFGSVGEIQEVEFALARGEWTHPLLKKATGGDFFGLIREVLEGRARICYIKRLTRSGGVIDDPKTITIDRTKPFDPSTIGEGWSFWRGSADGNGFEGELEQDNRSLALTQVDTSKILLEAHLKLEETYTIGEERLKRLIAADRIRLDLGIFQTFWNNKTLIPANFREKISGKRACIFFDGQILRSPSGERYMLYLYLDGGRWRWDVHWLGNGLSVSDPSVVLAS